MSYTITNNYNEFSNQDLANLYDAVNFGKAEQYLEEPHFIKKCFPEGVYGFFAVEQEKNELIGMIRLLSDDYLVTWVAEICVHPSWQKKGVGTALIQTASERFKHTSFYSQAFHDNISFFEKENIKLRENFVTCSRKAA